MLQDQFNHNNLLYISKMAKSIVKYVASVGIAMILTSCGGGGGGGTGGGTPPGVQLISISVSPSNASVAAGGTQQFAATGTYSDYSTANITNSVAWSSSSTGIATINASGLATARASGSATITATSGQIQGSATLTVSAWTTRLLAPRSNTFLGGIATDGTKYVVAGGAISTSTDLLVWEERKAFGSFNDVEWNGTVFVAVDWNSIHSSPDGVTWTRRAGSTCYA